MDGVTVRRAGAVALVAIFSTATLLVGAGPAVAAKRQPAGTYTATFPSTGTSSALLITNASGSTTSGTFKLVDFGDYGTWVAQGTTLAFEISTSNSGHLGAVLIGKLTAAGIGSGQIGQPGVGAHPWSATRVTGGPGAPATTTQHATSRVAAKGSTTYHAVFNGVLSDTLAVSKDAASKVEGPFALTTLADTGAWVKVGKKIAFGVTNGEDAGIVLVGTQNTSGISTAAAPGAYYQQGQPVHPWYATKG
jgi:hypothetical protein